MKSKTQSASLPKSVTRPFNFWQDRQIRFDTFTSQLKLRKRVEVLIAKFSNVQDTKGNNGYDGTLLITNLRLIWFSTRKHQVNLSIGLHTIQSISRQETQSKLFGGVAQSLHIPCKFGQSKFHFIFTAVRMVAGQQSINTKSEIKRSNDLVKQIVMKNANCLSPTNSQSQSKHFPSGSQVEQNAMLQNEYKDRLYHTVQATWSAYDSTQIYRELRVRSATIIDGDNVVLLSGEQVLEKMSGVSHVSNDEGFIGTLVITNLRLVWFATQEQNFNISLPYLHITGIHCQHSKFGPTLVLKTSSYVGSMAIAFRINPVQKLKELFKILTSFWKSWAQNPILGINVNTLIQSNKQRLAQNQANRVKNNTSHQNQQHNSTSQQKQLVKTNKFINHSVQDDLTAATSLTQNTLQQTEEDINVDDNDEDDDDSESDDKDEKGYLPTGQSGCDAFAQYYANDGQRGVDRRPVYDASIGLAVEKLKKGVTIQDLWTVPLPS